MGATGKSGAGSPIIASASFTRRLASRRCLASRCWGWCPSLTLRDPRQRQRPRGDSDLGAWPQGRKLLALLDTLLDTRAGRAGVPRPRVPLCAFQRRAGGGERRAGCRPHLGRRVLDVLPQLWPKLELLYRSVLETGQPVLGMELQGETAGRSGPIATLAGQLLSRAPRRRYDPGRRASWSSTFTEAAMAPRRDYGTANSSGGSWPTRCHKFVWTGAAGRPGQLLQPSLVRVYRLRRGAQAATTVGKPIVHPDDHAPRALATWYHAVHTGQPFQIEYRLRDQTTGNYRWHLGRALPSEATRTDGSSAGTARIRTSTTRSEPRRKCCRLNENLEQRVFEPHRAIGGQ